MCIRDRCYSDPSSHPFITDEERDYLAETLGQTERSKVTTFTVFSILSYDEHNTFILFLNIMKFCHVLNYYGPVSYTHLDVYKRQELWVTMTTRRLRAYFSVKLERRQEMKRGLATRKIGQTKILI